jgi:protein-S-isoprenylcysteine O-methyltransferase Ste14
VPRPLVLEGDSMKNLVDFLLRVALFASLLLLYWWAADAHLPTGLSLFIIVGGVLLTFPLVSVGRHFLDKQPTAVRAIWITTMVHWGLGFTLGVPLVRALVTHQDWPGWVLPIPTVVGWTLVIITGGASFIVVANLALRGLGAPFFIVLSRKLAVDWLYAWTRNPMVLAGVAFFLALGIWFQSFFFELWVLILFTPALLFFVKIYEERELEIRFGATYSEYRSRTPMLVPRKPRR